jgi:hypothetical protein
MYNGVEYPKSVEIAGYKVDLQIESLGTSDTYRLQFEDGYVSIRLSNTPTSAVINHASIEFAADRLDKLRHRVWDSQEFRTEEALQRAQDYLNNLIKKYELVLGKVIVKEVL